MKSKNLLGILLIAFVSMACWLPVLATPTPEVTITPTDATIPPTGATSAPTTPTQDATVPSQPTDRVNVFLIKLEDRGQSGTPVGCDDSLVALGSAVSAGDDPLISAYSALFAIRDERVGPQGLYNALHASNLLLRSSEVDENGRAQVYLEGTYSLGGVCDTPRMIAQLEASAMQFPNISDVQVYLNGVPIEEALSSQ